MFLHLISRSTAKQIGSAWYFTGALCKNGHIAARYTRSCACMLCKNEIDASRREDGKYSDYRKRKTKERCEYQRQWIEKNTKRHRKYKREWMRENVHKVKSYGLSRRNKERSAESDSSSEISAWIEGSEKVCFYCDNDCSHNYHLDHVIPISKGGDNKIYNMVIACQFCNLSKGNKDPLVFVEKILEERYV